MKEYNYLLKPVSVIAFITFIILCIGCTDRSLRSKELVKEGKRLLSIGQNDKALKQFEEAIKMDDNNFEAWHFRGSCKISQGDFKGSLSDFERAIEINPGYYNSWYNLGMAWFYLDDQDMACEYWKKAEALGKPNINDKTRHCP